MGFGTQLRVLLWKNFTLRKRQKFRLFAEIAFPLALFLILVIVRTRPDLKVNHDECHFDGNAMPSTGTWPFVQSLICNADQQCHTTVTADERPGFTASVDQQSLITRVLEDLGEILEPSLIQNLLQDGQAILRVLGMIRNGTATGGLSIGNIVTNPTDLRNQILNSNISLSPDVIDQLLNSSINLALPTGILLDFGECSVSVNRTNTSSGAGGQVPGTNMTAQDLQNLLCEQGLFNRTLIIPSDTVRETVQNQICNLTSPQFDQLYTLLLTALNDPNARDEIIKYIERNAGQSIVSSPVQFLQIYQDFMKLYAIYQQDQGVITAVENLFSQIQGATMGANLNVTQSVQSLVCGRGGTTQCRPGYYISGQSCLPCPVGTYQSSANQGSCTPCEDNLKTNSTASTREKDCQVTCSAGKEGDDDCEPCDQGYYKPTDGLYPCMKCPEQTTSDSTRTQCSIIYCSPGYYNNNGVCTQCMKGYYQSQYNQASCTMCPANHDTASTGSKSPTGCIKICPAGSEGSNCDKCQNGYFKSSSSIDGCTQCPDGYASSTDRTMCVLDCAAGTYIDGSKCTPCGYGTYQPTRAQSMCLACDPNKNTTYAGSVKKDDCKIYCGPGQEGTDSCAPCKDDYYKPTGGKTECKRCTGHKTSTSSDRTQCTELYCDRGYFYDSTGNMCKPCPAGQYKSKRGKHSHCHDCGNRREIIGNPGVQCKRTVCADLVDDLESTEFGKVVWRQLEPLVEGKIPYAPNSTAINEVIRMANKTFDDLFSIVDLADTWRVESDSLFTFLDTDPNIQLLRDFTCSEACDDVWHTFRQTACNGSIPGFNISDILAGQTVAGFDISSLIPGFASAALNNYITQVAGLNFSFMCDVDPNYSPCKSLFGFLYSGNDINISNFTWKDALNDVNQVLETVSQYGKCFVFDKFVGFKTEYELTVESLRLIGQNKYFGALVFDHEHKNGLESHVKYSIRMNQDRVDSTNKIQARYWRPGPRATAPTDTKYVTYGFAYLQDMIDHAIIKLQTNNTSDIGVFTQMFPYPCYIQDKFIFAISRSLPLFLVLAWVLSVAMICKNIVYEKEKRLKEVMKIMGLSNGVHWLAWFIDAFIIMLMSLLLLVIIMKGGKVLEYSDPSVILFMLTAFTIATISQCFLISVFFSKANIAACVAGFLYFMLYLPYPLCTQWEEIMTNTHKTIACLSSSVAFGFGCSYIARYEEQAIGIQWSNLADTPIVDDEFSLLYCIVMMLFDAVIYGLMTWYIEAVFPGQYGIPRPFYFMFMKSYWCNTSSGHSREDQYLYQGSTLELRGQNAKMEEEPKNKRVGVSIRNLKKIYKTGKKVAVDGLSINFYEGQISSFLGHNGAGKTTTMSILTGLFPPTDGTAFIYGHNILTDMDSVRNSLGMCPQHNVLFDKLTVEEHLWFYARLKNMEPEKVKREMDRMIKDVGLPSKRKELSSSLSGGMKRKLSVAIAFVGNAKTVILDEPTAGIDPYARKEIWELLLKLKKKRTIILSTHHMDEADVLGDRIAIISQGKLCCCGSSLYLKSQYGNGYYLTLVQDDGKGQDKPESDDEDNFDFPDSRPVTPGSTRTTLDVKPVLNKQSDIEDEGFGDNNSDEKSESDESKPPTPPPEGATMIPGFSSKRTTEFIRKYIKNANLVEESTTELTYQLPADAAHSGLFEALFKQLERSHKDLGISSFGISDTSLEEVFLKVADETGVDLDDESKRKKLEEVTDSGRFARPVTRLSFRRKKKKSFLKSLARKTGIGKQKIDSDELLDDTESVISVPASEKSVETGFSHMDHVKLKGKRLKLQQFKALFFKRFHRLRRSKKGFFFEIILPALFVLAAMAFAKIRPPTMGEPPLELHPWLYTPKKGDAHLNMFFSNDGNDFGYGADLTQTLLTKPWMGNRCMNPQIKQVSDYSCQADSYESLWTSGGRFTGNDAIDFPQCDCTSGFQVCPPGAGGPEPPKKLLPTTDYMYNMTGRNISDWLVKTMKQYQKRRYGGFSFGDVNNISLSLNSTRIREVFENVLFNLTQSSANTSRFFDDLEDVLSDAVTQDTVKVWYNNKGWAAIVAYANVMNNLILRSRLKPGQNPEDYGITTFNYPMNATVAQFNEETLYNGFIDVTIAICVIFAMSFVPASFVMVLIEERSSNSKHLQFVSGVNPFIYWLANFSWDMVNYLLPCVLSVIIFLCFQTKSYVGEGNLEVLIVLLILYGFAMAPLMYPFTRFFSVPSTAMVVLTSVNIFLGTTSTLATFIIEFLERDDEELANVNYILRRVFLLLPQYCLGRGLMDMSRNQLVADAADVLNPGSYSRIWKSPFIFDQVGRNMLSMFCIGLLFFIINLLVEYNFFLRRSWNCLTRKPDFKSLDDEDVDVANERKRINKKDTKDDVLVVENLTKVYQTHGKNGRNIAVDRSCFGVPNGQCFGLLGVNGAGKTTTFKMLTGDVDVTKGNATLNSHSILTDLEKVRLDLGYCPQFDAFDPLLTGREILCFFARLRGIKERDIKQISAWCIRKLGLVQYADKMSGDYSGGNKRKLSTAISLIGNPSVIFMDEPTTGMDPHARRFLWNCINNIVKDGRSVILTSHSMEECEALCNRLAIMVNGRLKCIGSTQHLKNRFGDGYTVIIRVAGEVPDLNSVKVFMSNVFGDPDLKEEHNNMVQYQLDSKIKLSRIFGQLEAVKEDLKIEDYSVSQTTLDQVFIHFASKQTDMLDDEVKNKKEGNDNAKRKGLFHRSGSSRNSIVPDESDMESVTGSAVDLMSHERTLNLYGSFRGETSDGDSLAGSTVELVRPNSARSSTRSTTKEFPNVQIF